MKLYFTLRFQSFLGVLLRRDKLSNWSPKWTNKFEHSSFQTRSKCIVIQRYVLLKILELCHDTELKNNTEKTKSAQESERCNKMIDICHLLFFGEISSAGWYGFSNRKLLVWLLGANKKFKVFKSFNPTLTGRTRTKFFTLVRNANSK